jgi:hypothetical protein
MPESDFGKQALKIPPTFSLSAQIGATVEMNVRREVLVMNAGKNTEGGLSAVPLLNAVYCADCENITNSPHDECSVCGSHSVASLFRMLGGELRGAKAQPTATMAKYNLNLTAEVREIPADELTHVIEFVTRLAEVGRDVKSLRINLEPVFDTEAVFRAA